MLLDATNEEHRHKFQVRDSGGQALPYVISYDTETKEVEMFVKMKDEEVTGEGDEKQVRPHLLLGENEKPIVIKFPLPGSYAIGKDGKKIE